MHHIVSMISVVLGPRRAARVLGLGDKKPCSKIALTIQSRSKRSRAPGFSLGRAAEASAPGRQNVDQRPKQNTAGLVHAYPTAPNRSSPISAL